MIGRAGRAGHAKLGEAFIIGKGDPDAAFGEWKDICQLLVAPVPSLHSQLLAKDAFVDLPGSSNHAAQLPAVHAVQLSGLTQQPSRVASSESGAPICSQQASIGQAAATQHAPAASHSQKPKFAQSAEINSNTAHLPALQHAVALRQGQQAKSGKPAGSMHVSAASVSQQAMPCQSFGRQQAVATKQGHRPLAGQQAESSQLVAAAACSDAESQPSGIQTAVTQHTAAIPQSIGHSRSTDMQVRSSHQSAACGSCGLPDQAAQTLPLQRMLLEAVANKSIQSLQDILRLAGNTLLAHQAQSVRVRRAVKSALDTLE